MALWGDMSNGFLWPSGTVIKRKDDDSGWLAVAIPDTLSSTTRSFTTPTRSLNTAFQISTTQDAFVSYSVDISATLTISGGATGTVTLQYADDSAFTTNVKTVQSSANGNTGTLTVGLSLTQTATAAVSGIIPSGKYVKIVTANTAGTPTFAFKTAEEVLL